MLKKINFIIRKIKDGKMVVQYKREQIGQREGGLTDLSTTNEAIQPTQQRQ